MQILIKEVRYQNFKGLESFTLKLDGQNASIYGQNATGKTTIADGIFWGMFGEDSRGSTTFEIKPLDENGQPRHKLDHSVELILDVDGKEMKLKRVFKETWTQKRGAAQKTLTGHKTEYFIDDAPVKKKEYESTIEDVIDKDTFKLLTSPTYFNQQLQWKQRRDTLLEICGDISAQEVINSNPDLSGLPEILGNRPLEKHREMVQSQKKKVSDKLQEIPGRINELQRSIQDTDYSRHLVKEKIQELEKRLEQARAGAQDPELARERKALEEEYRQIQESRRQEQDKRLEQVRNELQELQDKRDKDARELRQNHSRQEELQRFISDKKKRMDDLRSKFQEIQQQDPGATVEGVCPTCGQEYPADRIEKAVSKARQRQAERKKQIQQEGRKLKQQVEEEESELTALQDKAKALEDVLPKQDQAIQDKQAEKEAVLNQSANDPERQKREREIHDRLAEITQAEQSTEAPDTSGIEQELEAERAKLSRIDSAQKTKERIQELKNEEKELTTRFEELESQLNLIDEFTLTKIKLLEDKINSKFQLVRFKMFKGKVNGELEPTCQAMFNGVSVGYGLNTGATLAVGLDTVRALQSHYGIHAPCLIDNRESVNWLPEMDCQVISFIVDGSHPKLTVETQNTKEEAYA